MPAFGGLYSPYFKADATGLMVGLSHHTQKENLVRAVLEAVCYRTKDVVTSMERTLGYSIDTLKVDGGVTVNPLVM